MSTINSLLDIKSPAPIELSDPSLGRMLASRMRFNVMKKIANIPLEHISADDFAARFLSVVAKRVSENAPISDDAYDKALSITPAAFAALPETAIDALVATYLTAEAKAMVITSRRADATADLLPGERETERLLRLVNTASGDLQAIMEDATSKIRQHLAGVNIADAINQAMPGAQAVAALFRNIQIPTLPTIDLSAALDQFTTAVRKTGILIRQQTEISEHFRRISEHFRPIVDQIGETIRAAYRGFEARLEFYPKLANVIVPLAQRGWFVSQYFGLSEIDQLSVAAATSIDETEKCISKLYDEDFVDHLNEIVRDYPEREFVLRPAGDAHLRGEYALSVMAFFSQIDGICFAATKKYVFLSGDRHVSTLASAKLAIIKRDEHENPFSQVFGLVHEIMWLSISERLPMTYSESERQKINYDGINRHTVLHGIALGEYATRENSLKAFSFLSYMASLAKLATE